MSNSKRKKLEGYRNSQPYEVRVSKTLSYLLRHGAQKESLNIRRDGYVRVDELVGPCFVCSRHPSYTHSDQPILLSLSPLLHQLTIQLARPKLANQALTVSSLLAIVKSNDKQRFHLLEEEDPNTGRTILWIRANQGHSVDVGELELKRVKDPAEIPVVIHGTFTKNWEIIREPAWLSFYVDGESEETAS